MLYIKKLYFAIALMALLTACDRPADDTEAKLLYAASIVENQPDSALSVVESLERPSPSDEDLYNKYYLMLVQAKDKGDKDITQDTIIFAVKRYYLHKGDMENAALAAYYCGRLLRNTDRQKATEEYLDAEQYSKDSENYNLRGLIQSQMSSVLFQLMTPDEAIKRLLTAADYYRKAKKYGNEALTISGIGSRFFQIYLRNDDSTCIDSARYYYQKGLDMARMSKDSAAIAGSMQSMSLFLLNQGQKELSRQYSMQAIPYLKGAENKARAYITIANSFTDEPQIDSVYYYNNKASDLLKDVKNSPLKWLGYKALYRAEKNAGNYKQALEYYKMYADSLYNGKYVSSSEEIAVVQKKYDYEVVKNENNRLVIEQQWTAIIAILIISLALAVAAFLYRRIARNKSDLYHAHQTIFQLKEMALTFNKKENTARAILYQHFDILKKVAMLEGFLKGDEKTQGQKLLKRVNKIVYNQETIDWNVLYESMNQVYDGFFDIVRNKYPKLSESEFWVCCLSYAGLSNTELAVIMELSPTTVHMKKSNIRRKLGIEEYGNIVEFLDKEIPNDNSIR